MEDTHSRSAAVSHIRFRSERTRWPDECDPDELQCVSAMDHHAITDTNDDVRAVTVVHALANQSVVCSTWTWIYRCYRRRRVLAARIEFHLLPVVFLFEETICWLIIAASAICRSDRR